MTRCASAGGQCPRTGVVTVHIFGVGIRSLCLPCRDTYTAMGMDLRPAPPIPEWRKRSLARDETGYVA
jgi:hypothetical protein